MALSAKAQKTLVVALGSKAAAAEVQALVAARSGSITPATRRAVVDAMAGRATSAELIASLTSGATMSLNTRKRILTMMAGDATPSGGMEAMGNELINFVQTTPSAKTVL